MVYLFVSSLCPDCPEAIQWAEDKGLKVDILDITESMANLKVFLKLRDSHPFFAKAKKENRVGIPCFYFLEQNRVLDFDPDLNVSNFQ